MNIKLVYRVLLTFSALMLSSTTVASPSDYTAVYENDWLAKSGGTNVKSLFNIYSNSERYILKRIDSAETLGSTIRAVKVFFVDMPVSSLAMILQHEVFGHGGKLKDIGMKALDYDIHFFSGATYFDGAEFFARRYTQQASVYAGGMEATSVMAHQLQESFFENNAISNNDAVLHFFLKFDVMGYVSSTKSTLASGSPGHDVTGYVAALNNWHGGTANITSSSLRRKNWVNVIDPFLWYGLYANANYISTGQRVLDDLPMIEIGKFKYLPAMHLYLAPWGAEYHLNNHIKVDDQSYKITLRYGNTAGKKSYGISASAMNLYRYNQFSFGGSAEIWRQPDLKINSARIAGMKTGMLLSANINYELDKNWAGIAVVGMKSNGYTPGESLGSGLVFRAGISYRV